MGNDREARRLKAYELLTHGVGFSFQTGNRFSNVSAVELDLRSVRGFLVADVRGRVVGRVEGPMYGRAPDMPDALSVRSGFLSRRLVPAEAIQQIDDQSRVIGLRVLRESIRKFL